jgi:hypothetical protein
LKKKAARASPALEVAHKSSVNPSARPADEEKKAGKIIPTTFAIDRPSISTKSNLKEDKEISENDHKPKHKVRFAKNAAGTFLAEASRVSDDDMPVNDSPSLEPWDTMEGSDGCDIDLKSSEDFNDDWGDEVKDSDTGSEESSESGEDGQFYMFLKRLKH